MARPPNVGGIQVYGRPVEQWHNLIRIDPHHQIGNVMLDPPLYDLVSTVYYPELVDTMAMKMGTEAKSELISTEHVAQFARQAGLGGAQTLARVASLAERLLDEILGVEKPGDVSEAVAALIVQRSESLRSRFKKK